MNRRMLLHHSTGRGGSQWYEAPPWQVVSDQLASTFNAGGSVKLALSEKVYAPREGYINIESLSLEADPGLCRLIVLPRKNPGEKSNARTWWEPGNGKFRGSIRFWGDEMDIRALCDQFDVVCSLFLYFHKHKSVSESLIKETFSEWERSPFIGYEKTNHEP